MDGSANDRFDYLTKNRLSFGNIVYKRLPFKIFTNNMTIFTLHMQPPIYSLACEPTGFEAEKKLSTSCNGSY